MKSMIIKDSYPIQTLELKKIESKFPTTKEAASYLEKQIEERSVAVHSIAVVEYADRFVISFMDAPNPQAHEAMEKWVKGIKK